MNNMIEICKGIELNCSICDMRYKCNKKVKPMNKTYKKITKYQLEQIKKLLES